MNIKAFLVIIVVFYIAKSASQCQDQCQACTRPCSQVDKNNCKRVNCMYACWKRVQDPCKEAESMYKARVLREQAQKPLEGNQEGGQLDSQKSEVPKNIVFDVKEVFAKNLKQCEATCDQNQNQNQKEAKDQCLQNCMENVSNKIH